MTHENEKQTACAVTTTLIYELELQTIAVKYKIKNRVLRNEKVEQNYYFLANDTTVYMQNPRESMNKLLRSIKVPRDLQEQEQSTKFTGFFDSSNNHKV